MSLFVFSTTNLVTIMGSSVVESQHGHSFVVCGYSASEAESITLPWNIFFTISIMLCSSLTDKQIRNRKPRYFPFPLKDQYVRWVCEMQLLWIVCWLWLSKFVRFFFKYLHIFQCNCDPDDGPSSFLSSLQLVQKKNEGYQLLIQVRANTCTL